MGMRPIDADAYSKRLRELAEHARNNAMPMTAAQCEWTADDIEENAPTIGGWVSVKDRLPERYERILTYDKYNGVKENWLLRSCPGVSWSYGFHVTHWMPMPGPPKELVSNENDKPQ